MTDPATTRTVPPELSEFTPLEATQQTCGLLILHLLAQASLEDPELTEEQKTALILQNGGAPVLFIPEA